MHELQAFLDQALAVAREGFGGVNVPLGLIIAVVAAFLMQSYRSVVLVAAGATLAHVVVKRLIPLVTGQGSFRLPPLFDLPWWRSALVLYVGYVIVILVLYAARKALLKTGH